MKATTILLLTLLAAMSPGTASTDFPAGRNNFYGSGTEPSVPPRPLAFTENKGQVHDYQGRVAREVKFTCAGQGLDIFLMPTGITYQFKKTSNVAPAGPRSADEAAPLYRIETYRMDMVLRNANPEPVISTGGKSGDVINFYNYDALGVSSFAKVTYHNIYPGIDWVIYNSNGEIKYDFVVRPGGDPSRIQMEFFHQEALELTTGGSLTIGNRLGRIREAAPVSFQDSREVRTAFVLNNQVLSFELADYDRHKELVIDPAVSWATYYGGADEERGHACATDASGNVYLSGQTASTGSIASGGYQVVHGGWQDAFIVKFNSGGQRLWATYYGGPDAEFYTSCAVDGNGDVYLAGTTNSTIGIAASGHQNAHGGGIPGDGFLVKFNSNGLRQWATYYGGTENEFAFSCATDKASNVYLCGRTSSSSGMASGGHINTHTNTLGAFLVKFSSSGVRQWGTYYYGGGGFAEIGGLSCCTDQSGNVYMSGATVVNSGVTSGGHQNTFGGAKDAMLVKFDAAGVLQWATYYGGSEEDVGTACATDPSGNVYLGGYTKSTNNISSSGHQPALGGEWDGFLAKFNSAGVRQWGTYYGGGKFDQGKSVATDPAGNVYLAGTTASTNNIGFSGHQNTMSGAPYVSFLAAFNTNGTRLWGTYYGGLQGSFTGAEEYNIHSNSCASDLAGNVYLAGTTTSSTGIAFGGFQNNPLGKWEAFLVKFNCTFAGILAAGSSPNTICAGETASLSASGASSYSWSTGGSVSGMTVNPQNTTVYMVTGTDANGCASVVSVTVNVSACTGISDKKTGRNQVLCYPNPLSNDLFIETPGIADLNIYNALGQLILRQQLHPGKNKLDLSKENNGVYFLKINSAEGSSTKKVVKERMVQ